MYKKHYWNVGWFGSNVVETCWNNKKNHPQNHQRKYGWFIMVIDNHIVFLCFPNIAPIWRTSIPSSSPSLSEMPKDTLSPLGWACAARVLFGVWRPVVGSGKSHGKSAFFRRFLKGRPRDIRGESMEHMKMCFWIIRTQNLRQVSGMMSDECSG